jgi:hypothetical protein
MIMEDKMAGGLGLRFPLSMLAMPEVSRENVLTDYAVVSAKGGKGCNAARTLNNACQSKTSSSATTERNGGHFSEAGIVERITDVKLLMN